MCGSESNGGGPGSRHSCWVGIEGQAYDITAFLQSGLHPGGNAVLLRYAGRDATKAFIPIHPSGVLEKFLSPECFLGEAKASTPSEPVDLKPPSNDGKPKLKSIVNLLDFEVAGEKTLSAQAFVFKAGADSEKTVQWNRDSWSAIRFRPRVLVPVETIDLSTTLFGCKIGAPFFISPAGGGKLAHPLGEVLMAKAAAEHNILHWVCNMAGSTKEDIASVRGPTQTTFWQIYAMTDLEVTAREVKQAVALGYKGFALTVDGVYMGKRERDLRLAAAESGDDDEESNGGISATRSPVYLKFSWTSAVKWLRSLTDLPIAIKGIQTHEDAALCMAHGVQGVWLSNHGGRQLEGAPSAAETLVSIRENCPEVFDKCEVIVDGGITRGTDVVKALAMGAKAVGLGRPFLFALAYGQPGVRKAIEILYKEVETTMALVGVTSVDQLKLEHVCGS
ncbi:uncharacterized protein STEHIDRAFT_152872 [Stereum hirsutum FP-91666 SS1]|uniref:uncharacterized protein n=1 Tax=Stereum hirsutum (strain FP-91666) TaxID=721885 RepID=UPI000440AF47|nr:uncharacterized protein STEHIDRAFT_152872 [Stereum hirsutum FP-91666 SS1]EIM91213.1 hypothetical protein STEHIDRAFT_152872 [Stereum hirsutum FP-91666 SS1]